jgi:hypothetical protein
VVDDDGTAAADNDVEAATGIGPEEHGKGMVHGNCHGMSRPYFVNTKFRCKPYVKNI